MSVKMRPNSPTHDKSQLKTYPKNEVTLINFFSIFFFSLYFFSMFIFICFVFLCVSFFASIWFFVFDFFVLFYFLHNFNEVQVLLSGTLTKTST